MAESEKDLQARWILKQDLPLCVCKPTNPKHRDAWRCVTKEQLAAWKAAEKPPVLRDETAKRLASLWVNFSQHPVAKRLSGREELGLDTWDDAAGMSAIEKMMFE